MNSRRSLADLRRAASARLRDRRVEINRTVAHRALSTAPPTGGEASGYLEELHDTIGLAVEYAFGAVEQGIDRVGPAPPAVPAQAESAARSRVGLDVVLRRYASGYSTLTDFLHQEVRALGGDLHYPALQRELTALFDRLIGEVSEAYRHGEAESGLSSSRARRLERVRRLLAGELMDASTLEYDLSGWHQALIGRGLARAEPLRTLAESVDRRILVIQVDKTTCWAWLGGRRSFERHELQAIATYDWPEGALVASGTPAHGAAGWRLTHRQASKALGMALRRQSRFTSYPEVALDAAVFADADLVSYLEDAVLAPLFGSADRGELLSETVRAYFETGHNASSAAVRLGVSRQTVTSRLRVIEDILQRTIDDCRAEIDIALRVLSTGSGSRA